MLMKKKRYAHALFFCHLTIEKIVKALVVAHRNMPPPYSHDLRALAIATSLQCSALQKRYLDTLTTFNVNARYDTVKRAFSTRATRPYTIQWFAITRTLLLWLKKQFPKT